VHEALTSCCAETLVVGGGRYATPETRHIPDLRPGRQGPLAGIEAALIGARYRDVFIAAGDMPFVTADLVDYLLSLLSGHVLAVVPHFGAGPTPCALHTGGRRSPW
ncbi:MAG: NTP transferase domain-containing protein, partial [Actinomycetota bacterium]|nr:NTP transferase domain-containing protein [Actinomycetota bacterium]